MAKMKVTKALKCPTVSKGLKVTKGPNVSKGLKVTIFGCSSSTPSKELSASGAARGVPFAAVREYKPLTRVSQPPNLLHGLLCRPMEAAVQRQQSLSAIFEL